MQCGARAGKSIYAPALLQLAVDEQKEDGAEDRHDEAGRVKRRARCGLRKKPRDEAADDGAGDAEQSCHEEAEVLYAWKKRTGDEPDDETDDD